MRMLASELFQSDARTGVLTLLIKAGVSTSMRDLAKRCELSHQAVQKELKHLERLGLVTVSVRGAAKFVSANRKHPAYAPLKALLSLEATPSKQDRQDEDPVYESLVAYGAPLLNYEAVAHWSLEETVGRAALLSRSNATVLRVLPVVLIKQSRALNFNELLRIARNSQVKAEVGMTLELVSELLQDDRFKQAAERLRDRRCKAWRYVPEPKNRFERQLAETSDFELARRWHLHVNSSFESVRSFVFKHVPEFEHAKTEEGTARAQ